MQSLGRFMNSVIETSLAIDIEDGQRVAVLTYNNTTLRRTMEALVRRSAAHGNVPLYESSSYVHFSNGSILDGSSGWKPWRWSK